MALEAVLLGVGVVGVVPLPIGAFAAAALCTGVEGAAVGLVEMACC